MSVCLPKIYITFGYELGQGSQDNPALGCLHYSRKEPTVSQLDYCLQVRFDYNSFFCCSQEEGGETQWEYEDEDLTMEG